MAINEKVLSALTELSKGLDTEILRSITDTLTDSFEEGQLYDYNIEIEFLSKTILCSYFELFSNDINVEEDREFGFSDLQLVVKSLHDISQKSKTKENEIDRVKSNLLANLRDVSVEDYIDDNYLEDDVKVVESLLFPKEDNPSKLEEQIEQNQAIQSAVSRTITSIMSVYEQVMAGGFEIEPYFGISTLKRDIGSIKIENGKAKVYKSVALKGLAEILNRYYPVTVSNDRQFNMEKIIDSQRPVYFPFKIVEYVFGRVSTKNLKTTDYSRFDGGSGWEKYAEDYIKPNLRYFLNRGICHVVQKEGLVYDGDLAFEDEFTDIQTIKQALRKMERSMVTMVIIPELESTSSNHENWSSIKMRLVDVNNNLPSNQQLIGTIIKDLMDGLGSASGQDYSISPETVEDLASYKVYEYEHIFDSKMANIRPLFAYQALDALQSKGETVNWSNIILGKGMSGRTITSKEGGSINLSAQLIHNIIAGSRSGKGVMTLNILSTAIASGRPVFYLDRKPDMSALFAEYVGINNNTPNMFIVNGSAYEGRFDPNGVLNYDVMQEKWRNKVPSWWDATSYKDVGDIVYYRGILLTLGILLLRFWAETANRSLYDKMGGDGGIAIIYDEFTNWQNAFSSRKLNPRGANGLFGKDMLLNKKDLEEIEKALDELSELESLGDLNTRQRSTLRTARNTLSTLRSEKRAYATDLLDNLDRTLMILNEKKNAGFKNTEEKRSDIFVIGQNVEVKPLPEGITFSRNQASGGLNADRSYENTCAISTFLYNFSTDWFMGYNRDYKNYMKADDSSSPSHQRLTEEARNFAYYNGSRDAVMGNIAVSTIRSNAKFFKPYLILNNAKEPRPLSTNPEERKAQCQQAEYQYVGGVILNTGKEWEKIRQQNLQDSTDQLRQEIGFFDYLGQLSRGSGTSVDPKTSLGQSKQIADMVVQQMGYKGDYLDFLMDLRPEWNFSAQDVVDAFATPDVFVQGSKRLPTYLKLFGDSNKDSGLNEDDSLDLEFIGEGEDSEEITTESEGWEDESDEWEDSSEVDSETSDFTSDYEQHSDTLDSEGSSELFEPTTGTDYYKGEPIGAVLPTGVVDPFSMGRIVGGTQTGTPNLNKDYTRMTTDSLLAELQNRGVDLTGVSSSYENKPFGSDNEIAVFDETVRVGTTEGYAPVTPMRATAVTEEDYYTNYFDFCESVTIDIINTFGGYNAIEVVVVKDGILYVNNVKYNKRFSEQQLTGLPVDKKHQIANSNFAHVFNFAHLTKMQRLAYLSFDSKDFMYIKVRQDLKAGRDFDIATLFKVIPTLYYLCIRDKRYQRDTVEEETARNSSIFRSARKRQMVAQSAEKWGSQTVNQSWDSTKTMYQRKGWGWKVGGTAMLGVTALAGAGLLGFKGLKTLGREVKELFKT